VKAPPAADAPEEIHESQIIIFLQLLNSESRDETKTLTIYSSMDRELSLDKNCAVHWHVCLCHTLADIHPLSSHLLIQK
jgi:hypothetical protein